MPEPDYLTGGESNRHHVVDPNRDYNARGLTDREWDRELALRQFFGWRAHSLISALKRPATSIEQDVQELQAEVRKLLDSPLARIQEQWSSLLKEPLASQCRPAELAQRTLVIEAASAAMAQNLNLYYRPELLARISKLLGDSSIVTQIRVRAGRSHPPSAPSASSSTDPNRRK